MARPQLTGGVYRTGVLTAISCASAPIRRRNAGTIGGEMTVFAAIKPRRSDGDTRRIDGETPLLPPAKRRRLLNQNSAGVPTVVPPAKRRRIADSLLSGIAHRWTI